MRLIDADKIIEALETEVYEAAAKSDGCAKRLDYVRAQYYFQKREAINNIISSINSGDFDASAPEERAETTSGDCGLVQYIIDAKNLLGYAFESNDTFEFVFDKMIYIAEEIEKLREEVKKLK